MIKKFTRPVLAGFAALAVVTALATISYAHADDNSTAPGNAVSVQTDNTHGAVVSQVAQMNQESEQQQTQQMQQTQPSVSLNANGNFTVTGVAVNSVDAASNSITVTFYGFTRTINVAGAAITGGSQTIALGSIQPGDVLSGTGNFDAATHTLTVSSIIDTSYAVRNTANIQAQINQLMQLVQQLQARLQGGSSSQGN